MADKIQLIKEWVENLKNQSPTIPNLGVNSLAGFQLACDDVIAFINSLQEEHNEDLEEEFNRFLDEEEGVPRMWHSDEQMEWGKDIARHFAEWQKQQMMKDVVEGTVKYEIGSAEIPQCDRRYQVLSDPTPITNTKLGDKVKIIIVKEEQQ